MKKTIAFLFVGMMFMLQAADPGAAGPEKMSGKKEFTEHCGACHPEGGNIVNPQKTLHKKDRIANGVFTAGDIISKMRNPGPGMTQFNRNTVSDKEAEAIAAYIMKTFN